MIEFFILQHGEKARTPGDPPLTPAGREGARLAGVYLAGQGIARVYTSPLHRARETAEIVADRLGLPVGLDDRLRERMNWGDSPLSQTLDDFLADWARATRDRDFVPPSGDSSRAAGARFLALLDELAARHDGEWVALATHGGVTVDLLRTLFADDDLLRRQPDLFTSGVAPCALTHLTRGPEGYALRALGAVAHLR